MRTKTGAIMKDSNPSLPFISIQSFIKEGNIKILQKINLLGKMSSFKKKQRKIAKLP